MGEYRFTIVRYVPNAIREEPINVGLILHSFTDHYLAFNWDLRRARPKLTQADKETFKNYEQELELIENEDVDWDAAQFENYKVAETDFLDSIADNIGNKIRFSSPQGYLTDDPDSAFEELFQQYVATIGVSGRKITKRTLVKNVKDEFVQRGVGEYVKPGPEVIGEHKQYKLPLGIYHSKRTYIEVLKLGSAEEKNYRAMAAIGRLWQDAKRVPVNRYADLTVLLHETNGRLMAGERLLRYDGVRIAHQPREVVTGVDLGRARQWE